MKSRLGIVGPQDSVNLISEVAEEFKDRLNISTFIYTSFEETKDIVSNRKNEFDVWLFSGQVPYTIAKKYLKSQNGFYPQLNGSSLTKVLLDVSYKDKKGLSKLSFDTIPSNEVLETFSELELNTDGLMLYPYTGYKPTEELVDYHYQLYKNKKVDSCITGVHSVYKELISMNIPAYRIKATKMVIRKTILLASQRSEIIQFKSSQISILILQIYEMNKLIGENNVSFDTHRLSLKIQEVIIEFTEKIQGSFIQQGNEKFVVFSTRGALETNNSDDIFILLEKIKMITKLPANIGIGYGKTVFGAEQNAYLALNHANNYGKNTIMLASENGDIEGPLKNENSISFNLRTDDVEIMNMLKLASVSVGTYNKVISIQENLKQGFISAYELSQWLGMTQRNARRILGDLEKQELAEVVGEEAPGTRGRPRRLFRVGIKNVEKSQKR